MVPLGKRIKDWDEKEFCFSLCTSMLFYFFKDMFIYNFLRKILLKSM